MKEGVFSQILENLAESKKIVAKRHIMQVSVCGSKPFAWSGLEAKRLEASWREIWQIDWKNTNQVQAGDEEQEVLPNNKGDGYRFWG